jgi:hypothetical protein
MGNILFTKEGTEEERNTITTEGTESTEEVTDTKQKRKTEGGSCPEISPISTD